jgi:hypothetical protein
MTSTTPTMAANTPIAPPMMTTLPSVVEKNPFAPGLLGTGADPSGTGWTVDSSDTCATSSVRHCTAAGAGGAAAPD